MRVKKRYSAAQKFQAAISVIKGEKSMVEAVKDVGCHPTLIGNWKEAVLHGGSLVFEKENSVEYITMTLEESENSFSLSSLSLV
jgi:transposase-like protein